MIVASALAGSCWNAYLPERKSLSVIRKVEANRPPTFTTEPAPKRMPLGLMSQTRPLAWSWPRITEGSPPVTRLSEIEELEGWRYRTTSSAAML